MKTWEWVGLVFGLFSLLRAVAKGEYVTAAVVLVIAVVIGVVVVLIQEFRSRARSADREDSSLPAIPEPYQPGEGRKWWNLPRRWGGESDRYRRAAEELRQARIDDVHLSKRKRRRQGNPGSGTF